MSEQEIEDKLKELGFVGHPDAKSTQAVKAIAGWIQQKERAKCAERIRQLEASGPSSKVINDSFSIAADFIEKGEE